jgi:hypothetical protein
MSVDTDIPGFDYSSYYSDDKTPPETQCTGDDHEYGASGLWEQDPIPNTDPGVGPYNIFEGHRLISYGAPDQDLAYALAWAAEAGSPLNATALPYVPGTTAVENDSRPVEAGGGFTVSFGPNPLHGELRIRFCIPSGGSVSVRLYDVRGRRVATLAEGAWSPGNHEVARGVEDLPSGIYLTRATGPDGTQRTFRIVLLR